MQNSLLLGFYFVTTFGSSLSSIAAFLSVENYFHSLLLLGITLSARSFASAVFSSSAAKIILKLGLRNCFLYSQVFGCISLIILSLGFVYKNVGLMLLGIILTGLPATFVAILLTSYLRLSHKVDSHYRKASAKREIVLSCALLASSLLAPLFLWWFTLHAVFMIDGLSYMIGFLLILKLDSFVYNGNQACKNENINKTKTFPRLSSDTLDFFLKSSCALMLAGLLPLAASSSQLEISSKLPMVIREWLWLVEDITAMASSLVYMLLIRYQSSRLFVPLIMMNGVYLLLPLVFTQSKILSISVILINSFLIDFSFKKFRDDYVISAENNITLIQKYSAITQMQRNFILFLSPILLSGLFNFISFRMSMLLLCLVQFLICNISKFIVINRKYVRDSI